jgi:hypothetical protein
MEVDEYVQDLCNRGFSQDERRLDDWFQLMEEIVELRGPFQGERRLDDWLQLMEEIVELFTSCICCLVE